MNKKRRGQLAGMTIFLLFVWFNLCGATWFRTCHIFTNDLPWFDLPNNNKILFWDLDQMSHVCFRPKAPLHPFSPLTLLKVKSWHSLWITHLFPLAHLKKKKRKERKSLCTNSHIKMCDKRQQPCLKHKSKTRHWKETLERHFPFCFVWPLSNMHSQHRNSALVLGRHKI